MGKKGEQMAAAATNAPAEDAGADDGGEGAGAATEVMGASLRNPDVHLAWLEPTPAEAELLAALEKEHPGMPGLAGAKLRFLRANSGAKEAKLLAVTAAAYKAHVEWEDTIKPREIGMADIQTSLDSGAWRFMGKTDAGSPILWIQAGKWNPHEYKIDEYEKYVAWFCARSEHQMDKATTHVCAFDMSGWAMWHARYISYIKKLVAVVQGQYPERLAKVLVINAPVTFRAVWAIIKPWLDVETAAKVQFCNGIDATTKAFEEQGVSQDVLIDIYGGNQKADTVPVPNVADMPAATAPEAAPDLPAAATPGPTPDLPAATTADPAPD